MDDNDACEVPRLSTRATTSSPWNGGPGPTGSWEIFTAILIFIYFGAFSLQQTAITTASFVFATEYTLLIILAAIGGIAHGGQGVILHAIYSEAIDNATLKSGIREESSYVGIMRFFSATAIFWQVLIFAIVGTITGYDPQLGTENSDFAKLGLLLQMSIIPATIMLISSLIFFKLYDITKEISINNKKKLIELDL